MRSLSTSSCEQSENSSREGSPSPQTPLDAGAFVHSAIANMNYRKSAIVFEHPCRILSFYTPSDPSLPLDSTIAHENNLCSGIKSTPLFNMYLLLPMSCYPPQAVVFSFMPPSFRLGVVCVTTVALWDCRPQP